MSGRWGMGGECKVDGDGNVERREEGEPVHGKNGEGEGNGEGAGEEADGSNQCGH